jgi:hypothetical protein
MRAATTVMARILTKEVGRGARIKQRKIGGIVLWQTRELLLVLFLAGSCKVQ